MGAFGRCAPCPGARALRPADGDLGEPSRPWRAARAEAAGPKRERSAQRRRRHRRRRAKRGAGCRQASRQRRASARQPPGAVAGRARRAWRSALCRTRRDHGAGHRPFAARRKRREGVRPPAGASAPRASERVDVVPHVRPARAGVKDEHADDVEAHPAVAAVVPCEPRRRQRLHPRARRVVEPTKGLDRAAGNPAARSSLSAASAKTISPSGARATTSTVPASHVQEVARTS